MFKNKITFKFNIKKTHKVASLTISTVSRIFKIRVFVKSSRFVSIAANVVAETSCCDDDGLISVDDAVDDTELFSASFLFAEVFSLIFLSASFS